MWQVEIVRILRHLINDLDDTSYTYSDTRLEEAIIVAAGFVINDLALATTYTCDVDQQTLSPDPTTSSPKDMLFISLLALRSACLIDNSTFRTKALHAGIVVKDGQSSIDTKGNGDIWKYIWEKGHCQTYKEMLDQNRFGNGSIGEAILGAFSSPNISTSYHDYDNRQGVFH